jgi:HEAT repeat protein
VTRTIQIVAALCLFASCLRGETPPALDSTDEHAIELALHAIKMTPRDLSFIKTNVESELVLHKASVFLQHPLALPSYGQSVMSNLETVTSMAALARFSQWELEIPVGPLDIFAPMAVDPAFLNRLPPPVARAIQTIVIFAGEAKELIADALPQEKNGPFAAFAVDTFELDKDKAELESWGSLGIDTRRLRDVLKRNDNLELQDDELAQDILNASDKLDSKLLFIAFEDLSQAVDSAIADLRTNTFTEEFQYETDTPLGKIIVGGAGHNVYSNEAFLIIDTGGADTYLNSAGGANGLVGRPISIVIDLGGNDQFISKRSFSQGSGVFGIGILAALGSNCTFQAKNLSQGAGFFGCGLLMTGEGKQTFEADTFCQGAGMFGAGILWQRGGDTTYKASEMAQGFGGTSGLGLLLDESGDDSYVVGGKYPCGWLPKHFFTLSQGFGYGMRPFAGGGVGILCDLKGNDHYVADVYGQGASYWYSVGLLLDAEGNDIYDAYQYCQGAGIHLSSGALIDWSGNDTYTAGHICQGAAHDYAVGILIDRAGDDKYSGDTTAQGAAINNSFALLLDRAGNDLYTGTDTNQSQAAGHDGGKREYGSIGLLLDLGGQDHYSQGQTNNAIWLKPFYGSGLDYEAATNTLGENVVAALLRSAELNSPKPFNAVPQERLYTIDPVDPHHPIEHLLRLANSDKPDAAAATEELKKRGAEALPYLITRLDSPEVLVRAKTEEVIDSLGTNSIPLLIAGIDHAKNDEVARLCCYYLARFDERAGAAIPSVLPLIDRYKTRTTAFYTLGHLRARAAFAPAMAALADPREMVRFRAAQALGRIGDVRAIPKLITALNDEMWDVRYAAEDSLVVLGRPSIGPLRAAFAKASPQARPHILEALAKLGDKRALAWAKSEYKNDDALVRTAIEKQLTEEFATATKKH